MFGFKCLILILFGSSQAILNPCCPNNDLFSLDSLQCSQGQESSFDCHDSSFELKYAYHDEEYPGFSIENDSVLRVLEDESLHQDFCTTNTLEYPDLQIAMYCQESLESACSNTTCIRKCCPINQVSTELI